jgi:glycosyltransferase involved in cell wall biosynthesis
MRILHVVTAFPRAPGDIIAPWLVELLRRQRAAGLEVEVFAPAYRGGGNAEFEGIPVHRFRYFPARWEDLTHDQGTVDRVGGGLRYKLMAPFYVLAGMRAAFRLARRREYVIVHVHWPVPHALFGWAARRGSRGRTRLVTLWYGIELRWVKSRLPWLKQFLKWALKTSDQVVAISSYTAREVAELVHVPVRVIPYGLGFPESLPETRDQRLGNRDVFQILYVGNLIPRKGVKYLIDALQRLPPTIPAKLLILGEGTDRPKLEAQVRELGLNGRVSMPGRVPDSDLHRAFHAASVLVLPSIVDQRGDTEGLGVVLIEAMAYRIPVIGSAIGGITDIISDGATGLLVPPEDPAAIAAAIARIAADPALAERLALAGSRRVRERFGWDAITAAWQECYAAALQRRLTPRATA